MHHASAAGYAGSVTNRWQGPRKRGVEIVGIILGFVFLWPAALAYLVWKLLGYPIPVQVTDFIERHFSSRNAAPRAARFYTGAYRTGNFAFDEYRRSEIERLEAERRKLDEEAREFAGFVEELKRAKDREEFDAFMAKRRAAAAPNEAGAYI
jgi:hypothetical protein